MQLALPSCLFRPLVLGDVAQQDHVASVASPSIHYRREGQVIISPRLPLAKTYLFMDFFCLSVTFEQCFPTRHELYTALSHCFRGRATQGMLGSRIDVNDAVLQIHHDR